VGYPPIRSKVKKNYSFKVTIPANVSSQYISALLLVAAKLENGIELTLDGDHFYSIYQNDLALLNDLISKIVLKEM
jgi:3-phosphoshikimate 1-carboxyvinyltransferase